MITLLTALGYFIVTVLVGIITAAVVYARWHYGTLEKVKGLPALIKPAFVGGSDLFLYKKIVHDADTENVKKYGKVYGFYEGRDPQIYVADVEMVRLILVKDFDHFQNKRALDFGHELFNESIDFLPYQKWKTVRNFISPSLSTGKIKAMSISMREGVEDWLTSIKKRMTGGTIRLSKNEYTALTADIIARTGYGIRMNSLDDPNNPFLKHAINFFGTVDTANVFLQIFLTFPILARCLPLFDPAAVKYFGDLVHNVMTTRRQNGTKLDDFVDVMNAMLEQVDTEEYKKLGITKLTVHSQAFVFLFAAFETTSQALTFTTYNLAKHPDIQEKVIKEVDEYLTRNSGKVEHETLNQLPYLSACILESLRLFASLIRLERVCTKEWTYEPLGLTIPEGMTIQIPVFAMHFDPEYFPEPHAFKPERFMPENKDQFNQYAYLAFGLGNHNCMGMRMAKENVIIAMTRILENFKFRATEDTKVKARMGSNLALITEPFSFEAVKRK